MIVSANPDKKNISCFSSVSKTHHEKIDASKWCAALKEKFGGRGGGKPTNSQWAGIYQSAQTVLLRAAKNLQVAHLLRGMRIKPI